MDFGKELLFFFSALGAFNGLVLSGYFFFFNKNKRFSNYFLGALLLALSIRIGKSVLFYFNHNLPKIYLQIGLSACFFIGPCLFYFLKSDIEQIKKMPKKWAFMLAFLMGSIVLVGFIYPYQQFPQIWNGYLVSIIYAQWGIFIVLSGILLKNSFKKLGSPQEKFKPSEIWLLTVFIGNLLVFLAYLWAFLGKSSGVYISGAVSFSFILYLVIFVLLYRKKTDDLFSTPSPKYADKKWDDADAQMMLNRLEKLMVEKEVFKNPNLKLNDLAKEINISGHQLSQLLNDNLDKNFTLFINEYRINEACKILSTDSPLTVEAISYEVGFNSKSTFFSTFKKLKGMTPAMYQQNTMKV
jgi:AraC-like DNA-binding protein